MAIINAIIPTYRGMITEANGPFAAMMQATNCNCRDSQGRLQHEPWKCPKGKHSVRIMPPTFNSSVVHWARNQCVAQGLYNNPQDGRPPADYLFLMDDDMMCEPHYLLRMASYKLDIVVGPATIRRDPPRPNIRKWDEETGAFKDYFEWDFDSQKLFEVGGAGMAFALISRKVFLRMGEAHLNCEFELAEDLRKTNFGADEIKEYWQKRSNLRWERFNDAKSRNDWAQMDCWWFQFANNCVDTQIGEAGEDMTFSWKAKKLGFKIWADPQVLPGHLGLYSYSIRDWREQFELMKAEGQYSRPEEPKAEQAQPEETEKPVAAAAD